MPKERRKEPRFAFNRVTTFRNERNGSPRECLITNLSRDGARLFSEAPGIPDQFDLAINETLARRCQVVWRLGGEIGVKFLDGSVPIGGPAFEH